MREGRRIPMCRDIGTEKQKRVWIRGGECVRGNGGIACILESYGLWVVVDDVISQGSCDEK